MDYDDECDDEMCLVFMGNAMFLFQYATTNNMFGSDWNFLGADDCPSLPVLNMRSDSEASEERHLMCRTICLKPTTNSDPTELGLHSATMRLAENLLTNCPIPDFNDYINRIATGNWHIGNRAHGLGLGMF